VQGSELSRQLAAKGHVWTVPAVLSAKRSGAVMYSARQALIWADRDPRRGSHHCRLSLQTSHPAGVDPNHCPAFGTGELQENGTTLCKRRRSAMPNNGDVPSDWRAALRSQRRPECGAD
jgi:hypothetical protein